MFADSDELLSQQRAHPDGSLECPGARLEACGPREQTLALMTVPVDTDRVEHSFGAVDNDRSVGSLVRINPDHEHGVFPFVVVGFAEVDTPMRGCDAVPLPSHTAAGSGRAVASLGSQPDGGRALERHTRPDPRRYETTRRLAFDSRSGQSGAIATRRIALLVPRTAARVLIWTAAVMVVLVGCSSDHRASGGTSQSTAVPSQKISDTANKEGTQLSPLCLAFPDQVLPSADKLEEITFFEVGVFPEGEGAHIGEGTNPPMTPALAAAFRDAKKLVPTPLPEPLSQPSCCEGGYSLTIGFASGERVFYGPCASPDPMYEVEKFVMDATHPRST